MNKSTTTMTAPAAVMANATPIYDIEASWSASVLRRAAAWLNADCVPSPEYADRLVLYRVVDHCDLEYRMRLLERRRAQSGAIGGNRH